MIVLTEKFLRIIKTRSSLYSLPFSSLSYSRMATTDGVSKKFDWQKLTGLLCSNVSNNTLIWQRTLERQFLLWFFISPLLNCGSILADFEQSGKRIQWCVC